jgi:hypothetical protein
MKVLAFPKLFSRRAGDHEAEVQASQYAAEIMEGEYSPSLMKEMANFFGISDDKMRDFDVFLMAFHSNLQQRDEDSD